MKIIKEDFLLENFSDEEIKAVVEVVQNAINAETIKPVIIGRIRDQYIPRKYGFINTKLSDGDIKFIIKNYAKHIRIIDRNNGLYFR